MENFNLNTFFDAVKKQQEQMEKDAEPEKNLFEQLKNLGDLQWLSKNPPRREFLFSINDNEGFLPAGKTSMIVSPGGCGKTFLLTHCALAAATGTSWLHTKANNPIKVLFVAAEEDESELWIRFHNMAKSLGFHHDSKLLNLASKNIIPFASRGVCQRLIDDKGEAKKHYEDLKNFIAKNEDIKLVILDPASRFMGAETETNNAAATDFINLIDGLTMVGGRPTVLIAHHTNKAALNTVSEDKVPSFSQAFSRGSSALIDGCRWMLGIQRSETKNSQRSIFIKVIKSNYSKLGQVLEFEQDYANSGTLKFVGEITPEIMKSRKIDDAWQAAERPSKPNHLFGYVTREEI
ncbi:AAA family ATPase [Candidatus Dojkabacteria bacterium]|uniref:AAA family ATPase n=1 Tax=Candidatus Dojkabacteria bacterium TaxID=2099670 RepID=A0A5C7J6B5_9BACT|nr:MAG: AAA family ATPase [Candidatus Dojkabacteria bacterium]